MKIIPNGFGEKPALKLMFGAMIRVAERWRAINLTDFERRQLAALRKKIDQEYEAQSGLSLKNPMVDPFRIGPPRGRKVRR